MTKVHAFFRLVLIETQFPILSQSRRLPLLQVVSNKPLQIKEPVFFMFLFSSVQMTSIRSCRAETRFLRSVRLPDSTASKFLWMRKQGGCWRKRPVKASSAAATSAPKSRECWMIRSLKIRIRKSSGCRWHKMVDFYLSREDSHFCKW